MSLIINRTETEVIFSDASLNRFAINYKILCVFLVYLNTHGWVRQRYQLMIAQQMGWQKGDDSFGLFNLNSASF